MIRMYGCQYPDAKGRTICLVDFGVLLLRNVGVIYLITVSPLYYSFSIDSTLFVDAIAVEIFSQAFMM
jgi:hypothetical protein